MNNATQELRNTIKTLMVASQPCIQFGPDWAVGCVPKSYGPDQWEVDRQETIRILQRALEINNPVYHRAVIDSPKIWGLLTAVFYVPSSCGESPSNLIRIQ